MPERVMINNLPEQTTVLDTDLLVVQDATATKKMTVGRLTSQTDEAINSHLVATVDAHNASAISVVPGSGITSTNVQTALVELQGEIGAGGITTEDAVDAIAAALVEGANIDIVYSDVANSITISSTGTGITTEDAVDSVAAALAAGTHTNITVTYNDAANSISLAASGSGGGAGGHASFTFNSATTEPPTGNQLRLNTVSQTAATRLWVAQTSTDGLDVTVGLQKILAGHQIYIQDYDDASRWVKYAVLADGVDDGTYFDFQIAYHSGPANVPFQTIEFQAVAPGTAGVPPGGTVGQVLGKTGAGDFVVGWVADQVGTAFTTEDAVDAVAAALVAGTNVTITYNDSANTITIEAVGGGGGGGLSTEDAVDAVAAALVEGAGIDILYSDLGNTITISVTGVPIASITGLQAALDAKATTAALAAHEADTTAIHGIANTAVLETQTGAQNKVDAHIFDTSDAHQASAIGGLGTLATKSVVVAGDIANDSVTNAKLDNMAANRVKGAISAGDPVDLTGTQVTAMLDMATTVVKGLAPPLTGSASVFLNGTGAYSVPPVPSSVQTQLDTKVTNGGGVATVRALTQAAYDALTPKDANTLYLIT